MSKRIVRTLFCVAALATMASAHADVVVTVGGAEFNPNGQFSTVPDVTHIVFDDALPIGVALGGDFALVSGSVSGHHAAPPNSGPEANTSVYLTVPNGFSSGMASLSLPLTSGYFGLYWGSIDGYNTLSFLLGATEVFSYTGTQAAALAGIDPNGAQASATYFNFAGLPQFDTVRMTSTGYAFETDNHAFLAPGITQVPTPATAALLGLGILGIALTRRSSGGH